MQAYAPQLLTLTASAVKLQSVLKLKPVSNAIKNNLQSVNTNKAKPNACGMALGVRTELLNILYAGLKWSKGNYIHLFAEHLGIFYNLIVEKIATMLMPKSRAHLAL